MPTQPAGVSAGLFEEPSVAKSRSVSAPAAATDSTPARAASERARFWEIDALRGVAIITMIVYHLMWDLVYLAGVSAAVLFEGFWKYWQRFTCTTFIMLAGVSMTVVYRRERERHGPEAKLYGKFFRRGLKIFGFGMLISALVWSARIGYVDFGILHLIGFSMMAGYFFLNFPWFVNVGFWAFSFWLGGVVQQIHFDGRFVPIQIGEWATFFWLDGRWLTPIGIYPTQYPAVDYFPIFPWFGVFVLGIALGNWFYANNRRRIPLPDWGHLFPFNGLQFLGSRSLVIYLIHQPLIYVVLVLLGVVTPF